MKNSSFEKVEIFDVANGSCSTKYLFNGKRISPKNYGELAYRFERVGFSSIKGIYQSEYKKDGNKSTHIDRYILNDTVSCEEEVQEVLNKVGK